MVIFKNTKVTAGNPGCNSAEIRELSRTWLFRLSTRMLFSLLEISIAVAIKNDKVLQDSAKNQHSTVWHGHFTRVNHFCNVALTIL